MPNHPILDALSPRSYLSVTDQVSHSYKNRLNYRCITIIIFLLLSSSTVSLPIYGPFNDNVITLDPAVFSVRILLNKVDRVCGKVRSEPNLKC
jgi:hypothetical protein